MPGSYTVALLADGKVVDTKPLKIVMDPQVQMSEGARAQYNAVVMDLHSLHRQGAEAAAQLSTLYADLQKATHKIDSSSAPANVKSDFASFKKEFDAVRAKFGIGIPAVGFGPPAGGGGGRGGGGGAAPNPMVRAATVKGALMGVWEAPSDAMMKQVNDVKSELPKVISEANAFLNKVRAMNQALTPYGASLTLPTGLK